MSRRLNIEVLAKRLKVGKESGENMLILRFWYSGRLFQFLILILYIGAHIKRDFNIQN